MCALQPKFLKNGFTTWILIQRAVADPMEPDSDPMKPDSDPMEPDSDPMEPDSDRQYFSNLNPITNGWYVFVFIKKWYIKNEKFLFFFPNRNLWIFFPIKVYLF